MAKKDKDLTAPSPSSLAEALLTSINEVSTSTKAYQLGDHAQHTWGIEIPTLAFQWLIGGSTVLPLQRYFSFSGITKSFKSTLNIEIGCWFVGAYRRLTPEAQALLDSLVNPKAPGPADPTDPTAGVSEAAVAQVADIMTGLFIYIDTENKSSGTMLDAMTWWRLTPQQRKALVYKEVQTVEEWMEVMVAVIKYAQGLPEAAKGKRTPIFATVDSLTGKEGESEQDKLMKEGHAESRGYPVLVMQITNFFKRVALIGTTMSMGYVRHLKDVMDADAKGDSKYKEAGGTDAAFRTSISIRVQKGQAISCAAHDAMPFPGTSVEGYTLYLKSHLSCIGPDKRILPVDILWQFVPMPDGSSRQLMMYDWEGALGRLLFEWKYAKDPKDRLYASDIERLTKAIYFVAGKAAKTVKCEALSPDDMSFTEFGRRIQENPEVRQAVSRFLNIAVYPSVQEADIDRTLPKKA